ncbi:MAG: hypothetical protein ABTQ28_02525, partial [Thauera sp.]
VKGGNPLRVPSKRIRQKYIDEASAHQTPTGYPLDAYRMATDFTRRNQDARVPSRETPSTKPA